MTKTSSRPKSGTQRLEALAEVSRVVLSHLDADNIFRIAADGLRFALGYLHVALFKVDELNQEIFLLAQSGEVEEPIPPEFRVDINQWPLGAVVKTAQPKVHLVDERPRHGSLIHMEATEIFLPISSHGKTDALLFVAAPAGVVPGEQEMDALVSLASHLGIAMQNAHAYSDLKNRHRALNTLLTASKELLSVVDREEILRRFTGYLFEGLPDCRAAIVENATDAGTAGSDQKAKAHIRRYPSPETLKRGQPDEETLPWDELEGLADSRNMKSVHVLSLRSNPVLPRQVAEEINAAQLSPYLVIPLVPQERVLALMVMNRFGLNASFASHELDLAQALANLVSLWLCIALLIEELKTVNHELAKSNELKSNLMSILSHDVKSPLHGIHGFAELVAEINPDDPTCKEATDMIMGNVKRIVAILDDSMAVSRMESGEMTLKRAAVELPSLIEELVAAHGRQGAMKINLPPDLPPVAGDRLRIVEVLENLISNALKYSRDGNVVTISARSLAPQAEVEVTVDDRGMGIAADELPRLFARYYRIRNEQTHAIEGTGLGLYIVKLLVEAHGGKVWAESVYGEGSQFHFTLPSAKPTA